eukprot:6105450-Prymnesium_polylepis.1
MAGDGRIARAGGAAAARTCAIENLVPSLTSPGKVCGAARRQPSGRRVGGRRFEGSVPSRSAFGG